ncbi:MAG: hypothetical protein MSH18_03130 [Bacteroidales bacterium]|nr:hypothetical protein [Bacteroidales bacterium]
MTCLSRLFSYLSETQWSYRLSGNQVRVSSGGSLTVGAGVRMRRCNIFVGNDAEVHIGENAVLSDTDIYIYKGSLSIGNHAILCGSPLCLLVEDGQVEIGHHTKVACEKLWVRFGGQLTVGNYTNINAGTEVRCDEKVLIGNYCQISYNIRIWDTNTHTIYSPEVRAELTRNYFPYFGKETERPRTSPVIIEDYCWMGERSAILKGTHIAEGVIVGFGTLICGKSIEKGRTVVAKSSLLIF